MIKIKKRVIFLIGGTGNNLFQINYAYFLISQGYNVKINIFFTKNNFISRMLKWSIHPSEITDEVCKDFIVEDRLSFIDTFSVFVQFVLFKLHLINIRSFNYNFSVLGRVTGYWQSECVLQKLLLDNLNKIYSLKNKGELNVIHARLGDFSLDWRLSIDYYVDAIEASSKREFVLITDSIEFKDEIESKLSILYVIKSSPNKSAREDFQTILEADLLISSNSTFCYWASQIKPIPKLIYPKYLKRGLAWKFPLRNKSVICIDN
jgi:hypothetical protein